ncbi:putative PHD finger protein 21A isoform X9 [Apostichopus japonicus]|uniref:Putative PHD finger protein 21A isoform X9 n=2 Tax=Stichopus japonicus TaxID=307972 RepID=A0A2G8LJ72_STIJA|nr:putative PHD finger protein 21A isoform X9 [Apostichopus japonicus]
MGKGRKKKRTRSKKGETEMKDPETIKISKTSPSVLIKKEESYLRTTRTSVKEEEPTDKLCNICNTSGTLKTLVSCDECEKCYHFGCLDPPYKKNPKVRGYGWYCPECMSSGEEDDD